jgi:hypothetical protein
LRLEERGVKITLWGDSVPLEETVMVHQSIVANIGRETGIEEHRTALAILVKVLPKRHLPPLQSKTTLRHEKITKIVGL